jgi:hypothetical protein
MPSCTEAGDHRDGHRRHVRYVPHQRPTASIPNRIQSAMNMGAAGPIDPRPSRRGSCHAADDVHRQSRQYSWESSRLGPGLPAGVRTLSQPSGWAGLGVFERLCLDRRSREQGAHECQAAKTTGKTRSDAMGAALREGGAANVAATAEVSRWFMGDLAKRGADQGSSPSQTRRMNAVGDGFNCRPLRNYDSAGKGTNAASDRSELQHL